MESSLKPHTHGWHVVMHHDPYAGSPAEAVALLAVLDCDPLVAMRMTRHARVYGRCCVTDRLTWSEVVDKAVELRMRGVRVSIEDGRPSPPENLDRPLPDERRLRLPGRVLPVERDQVWAARVLIAPFARALRPGRRSSGTGPMSALIPDEWLRHLDEPARVEFRERHVETARRRAAVILAECRKRGATQWDDWISLLGLTLLYYGDAWRCPRWSWRRERDQDRILSYAAGLQSVLSTLTLQRLPERPRGVVPEIRASEPGESWYVSVRNDPDSSFTAVCAQLCAALDCDPEHAAILVRNVHLYGEVGVSGPLSRRKAAELAVDLRVRGLRVVLGRHEPSATVVVRPPLAGEDRERTARPVSLRELSPAITTAGDTVRAGSGQPGGVPASLVDDWASDDLLDDLGGVLIETIERAERVIRRDRIDQDSEPEDIGDALRAVGLVRDTLSRARPGRPGSARGRDTLRSVIRAERELARLFLTHRSPPAAIPTSD